MKLKYVYIEFIIRQKFQCWNLLYARRGLSLLHMGEQQVALAAALVTTSDGGPGKRPVAEPDPPAVPSSRRSQGRLDVLECEGYAVHNA